MAYNGSGTFLINTAGQPVVSGTVISSTAFNALTADLATGLSTAITKDGQTTVTANIPMSTYKFTGLGVGSAATDSANLSQVQSTVTKLLNSVSGADTITATASPTLAAYAAGQMFYFVAAGDNTTSVTLNIDSLGAKAVTRDGATALAAADIKSGEVVVVVYDGTRFQVVSQLNSAGDARFANVSIASSLYVGGVSTFVGNAGFSANVSIASALSVGGVAAITGATTIGGNLTLSGGTANGVLYLNGSKVATSGSALTFNGTDFAVNTGSITSGNTTFAGSLNAIGGGSGATISITPNTVSGANGVVYNTSFVSGGSGPHVFQIGGSEQARLTSTGLGIGTSSPAYKLQVSTNANADATINASNTTDGTSSVARFLAISNAGSVWFGMTAPSYNAVTGASDACLINTGNASNGICFANDGVLQMKLDSSGNLGLGVTPTNNTLGKTLQVGQAGAWVAESGSNRWWLASNWYYNSGDKYINNGFATLYSQQSGQHQWLTAASGTAGNTISFTQAMTLDASGRWLLGTTTGVGSDFASIRFNSGGTYSQGLNMVDSNASANGTNFQVFRKSDDTYLGNIRRNGTDNALLVNGNSYLALGSGDTERGRFTAAGEFLVGKTAVGTGTAGAEFDNSGYVRFLRSSSTTDTTLDVYSIGAAAYRFYVQMNGTIFATVTTISGISDQRVKENIRDLDAGLDAVMALKPRKFDWKEGKGKNIKNDRGFIAQEFEQVFPDLVDEWKDHAPEGEEPYKSVRQDLIPVLVKAIQEQQAMIKSLEAKVAALEAK